MPYVDDDVMETLDYFMASIGRSGAWKLLKKRLSKYDSNCEEDGCKEAIEQTKINKANIEVNVGNITKNTTDIAELKNELENFDVDRADPDDVEDWFGNN